MVFDTQLGYDPDEWEECPEPTHFLAFSFPTRVALSTVAVLLSAAFFWMLESRKRWVQDERRDSILNVATPRVKEAIQRRASGAASTFWDSVGGGGGNKSDTGLSVPLVDLARIVEETEEKHRSRSSSANRRQPGPRKPLTPWVFQNFHFPNYLHSIFKN